MTDGHVRELNLTAAAEPAALGLFGLGIVTLITSSEKLGWTTGLEGMLPWVFFFGAFAQIIASFNAFKRLNAFGATAFCVYGLFWFAIGMTWFMGYQEESLNQLGFAVVGMLAFNSYMLYAAGAMNKAIFMVFFFIELMFLGMFFNIFFGTPVILAGIPELLVAIFAIYTSGAVILENIAGFEVLPFGRPLWKLKEFKM